MKPVEFTRVLRQCSKGSALDAKRVSELSDTVKNEVVYYLVKARMPIIVEFISKSIDDSWLNCMGYLYRSTTAKGYTFRHTCEQVAMLRDQGDQDEH